MAHEKAFLVCENKCFVEGVTKEQYDEDMELVNQDIDTINNLTKIEVRHQSGSSMTVIAPNSYNKTRHLFINDSDSSKSFRVMVAQGMSETYVKVSWIKVAANNTTLNTKVVYFANDGGYVELGTINAGETYYIEIENLSYTPAEEPAAEE